MKIWQRYALLAAPAYFLKDIAEVLFFDKSQGLGIIASLIGLAITLLSLITIIKYQRTANGNRLSFGEGVGLSAKFAIIAALVSAFLYYFYLKFFGTETLAFYREFISSTLEENPAFDDETLEQVEGMINTLVSPGVLAIATVFNRFIRILFWGLILSAVFKKENFIDSNTTYTN
jgi:hypothetical protein